MKYRRKKQLWVLFMGMIVGAFWSVPSSAQTISQVNSAVIPKSYDARDYNEVTPVKNQGNDQICWAYAVIACAEAAAIRKNIDLTPDYSEMHLAYYMGKEMYDPLHICGNDSTYYIGNTYLRGGGNNCFSTFALMNWIGIADEEAYPYSEDFYNEDLLPACARDDVLHLQNIMWLPMVDKEVVKQAIMDYGCVASAYYTNTNYFNDTNTAYYNPLFTNTNHAIAIVGWDDDYDASNFKRDPGENGAWLVKGSYGTEFGDEGFYWISYADASINTATAIAFAMDFELLNNFDHNYFYDGSIGYKTRNVKSGNSIASIFKTCGNASGKDELLKAIGMGVDDSDVTYEIQVYTELESEEKPCSGQAAFETVQTGKIVNPGFYTIVLDNPVLLYAGETFSIRVKLTKENVTYIKYFTDETYKNENWIGFVNETNPGQSFVQRDNGTWYDLYNENVCTRLKAYTIDLNTDSTPIQYVALQSMRYEKSNISLYVGDAMELKLMFTPENAELQQPITWTSSDDSVVICNNGQITAKKTGKCMITATVDGITAECNVEVKELPVNQQEEIEPVTGDGNETEAVKSSKSVTVSKFSTVSISKLKKNKSKLVITLKKKYKNLSGYQIKLASNKNMTKNVKIITVKYNKKQFSISRKTKQKYLKIRAYRIASNGKKQYGKWSKQYKIR